ncbi:hypothetical protein [Agrobacterium tumefaciens]|uniref:hypothetical protein n=1 Tax=Agrobacterium tumefaciens TaxID=358 RepID=UPI001571C6BE|nr:hypothetical protein [Agrobacterium tumefaciens]WCJ61877.1 hypothetical protein G6M15_10600 [Agrobacterium tumefaciens]
MNTTISRSDVLKPLAWLITILISATIMLTYVKAPENLIYLSFGLAGVTTLLYFFAYVFCLLKDRDALRSEKYSLNKMAIEHGLLGDSNTGVFEIGDLNSGAKDVSEKPVQIEHAK